MKSLWTKCTSLLFALSLLASCGGGGGGGGGNTPGGGTGDTMTVTIGTNAPTTYNGNGSDPILTANVTTKTYINMASGYNFMTSSWQKTLNITVNGTTTGTYTFSSAADPTGILYSDVPNTYQGTSGTITITSMGNVGQPITGTFSATLLCGTGCTGSTTISGSFSVTRT